MLWFADEMQGAAAAPHWNKEERSECVARNCHNADSAKQKKKRRMMTCSSRCASCILVSSSAISFFSAPTYPSRDTKSASATMKNKITLNTVWLMTSVTIPGSQQRHRKRNSGTGSSKIRSKHVAISCADLQARVNTTLAGGLDLSIFKQHCAWLDLP